MTRLRVTARHKKCKTAQHHAVPAVVINGRHLVSGGQPVAVYVQALRQVAEAS